MSRLRQLCREGNLAEVRAALTRGEDVNDMDLDGSTALMLAVEKKHNPIVKPLLDQPAVDVNVKDKWGRTLLHIAAKNNNAEGARMLLLRKDICANVTNFFGNTALIIAIENKYNPIVKLLLVQPAVDVNKKNKFAGQTALHRAAYENNAEGARMLLLHKDFNSVNVTDNHGNTALMIAVYYRSEETLRELVKHQCVSLDVGHLERNQR